MDVPAVCGLKNGPPHANTCFMNAVIQCLSNTDLFAEYFVADFYKIDRKKHCKVNSRTGATRGEVTEQLAGLLKSLWSLRSHSDAASRFKHVVCKYGPQYQGSAQHDAQEFLLWLLDLIHEELNLSPRKPQKKSIPPSLRIDDNNSPNCSLADHLRFNQSFIHDLFQSQLRSSLSCICGRQSTTVDPLLCFSISIPTCLMSSVLVNVTFVYRHKNRVKVAVSVDAKGTIRDLRDRISRQLRVPEKRLVLLRLIGESSVEELRMDSQPIQETLSNMEEVFAIETYTSEAQTSDMLDVVLVNRDKETGQLFGPIISSQVSRSSSFRKMQLELLHSLRPLLSHSLDLDSLQTHDMQVQVVQSPESEQLPSDVDHPLLTPIVDQVIASCEENSYRGPVHLNLILDWKSKVKERMFVDANQSLLCPANALVETVTQNPGRNVVSLYDCLDLYFREEKLLGDNAWICPSCKKRTASVKKLTLWTLPDVFIIHLKRFRQSPTLVRSKLTTPVTFPLTGLDMSPFLHDRSDDRRPDPPHQQTRSATDRVRSRSASRQESLSLPSRWIHPWKRPNLRWNRSDTGCSVSRSTYDLVSVCNHTGTLLSGHYTATCRNPVNHVWYHFDDTAVSVVKESAVMSANAYLLFYERSGLSPANSCDSTTSGYVSSTSFDSRRLQWQSQNMSYSRDARNTDKSVDSSLCWTRSRDDVRGSFAYATMPPAKTRRSFRKILFRKKNSDQTMTRKPDKWEVLDKRLSGPASGLRVILPEEPSASKSSPKEEPESVNGNLDHEEGKDRLFCTVTSV